MSGRAPHRVLAPGPPTLPGVAAQAAVLANPIDNLTAVPVPAPLGVDISARVRRTPGRLRRCCGGGWCRGG